MTDEHLLGRRREARLGRARATRSDLSTRLLQRRETRGGEKFGTGLATQTRADVSRMRPDARGRVGQMK